MKKSWAGISILIFLSMLTGCNFPGWSTYTNSPYSFQLQYPPKAVILDGATDTSLRIQFPITAGTTLEYKWLNIYVQNGVFPCDFPKGAVYRPYDSPVNISLNGLNWTRENFTEGGTDRASVGDTWTAYSTANGNVCVSLFFDLEWYDPWALPRPAFDLSAESAVFIQVVDTFQWLSVVKPTQNLSVSIPIPAFAPTDTPLPLPSDTPLLSVHILAPSDTPTTTYTPSPSPLIFTPQISPMEFNYPFQTVQGPCTGVPQVDISVGVSDPSMVHGIELFFRLKDKATGAETPWNDGGNMSLQGNGKFTRSVSANQIPNLATLSSGGGSAWLEYQFVATNLQGSIIGRSQVYSDVSLTPCK